MFDPQEGLTENKYTLTIALLVMAFVFSPAILLVSRPVGIVSVSVAAAGTTLCIFLAWRNWKKYSLAVPPYPGGGPSRTK